MLKWITTTLCCWCFLLEEEQFAPQQEIALIHLRGAADQYQWLKDYFARCWDLWILKGTCLGPNSFHSESPLFFIKYSKSIIHSIVFIYAISHSVRLECYTWSSLGISIKSLFWLADCLISKLPTSACVIAICHHSKIVQIHTQWNKVLCANLCKHTSGHPHWQWNHKPYMTFFITHYSVFCIM